MNKQQTDKKNRKSIFGMIALAIIAVALIAGASMFYIVTTMPWMNWDNTDEDRSETMPGDDLSWKPNWSYTQAITINAPADRIFPWIDQIGQDRGGFYSYELLENIACCNIRNADRVHPEWQYKGDGSEFMTMSPKAPKLPVAKVIPGIALIVHAGTFDKYGVRPKKMAKDYYNMTWVFYLKKLDWNRTRLMVRTRSVYYPSSENETRFGPELTGFMNFFMGDAMLRGIKERVEKGV
jgi:hypothetical protein